MEKDIVNNSSERKIYEFYIFARNGAQIFLLDNTSITEKKKMNRTKLLMGLLWSLKSFSTLIAPPDLQKSQEVKSFTTKTYKMHMYESLTGYRFVIISTPNFSNLNEQLKKLYNDIFIPHVCKNSFYSFGSPIKSLLFKNEVELFVASLLK